LRGDTVDLVQTLGDLVLDRLQVGLGVGALDACTDSSRMRCRLSFTWSSAPSVVCAREMPSLALLLACDRPVICEVMRLAIAWPAASSDALLIFRPDDRRSIEVLRLFSEEFRFC